MKKINLILTFMLAWVGVSNVQADLTTDHYLASFNLSGTKATELTADAYYILQNRATSEYLIDNNGTLETTATVPVSGDTQDENVNCKEYLFQATTATGGFNVNGIYGTSLPALKANPVSGDTIDEQLVKPMRFVKAANSAVYTTGQLGAVDGYLRLVNNGLYLNCDLVGAESQDSYTAWTLVPVTVTQMIYIPVTCMCGTETIQSGSIYVPIGTYGGPKFTDYTLDQDSVAVTTSTKSLTLQYTQTAYTITYIYKGSNGSTWYTEKHPGLVAGSKYPAATLAPGVSSVSGVPTGTISKSRTVTLTCSAVYGFELYDSYDAIDKWYNVSLSGGYLYYQSGQTSMSLTTTTKSTDDAYIWGFVGNPYTGITIYNKGAGSSMKLVSPDPTGAANTGLSVYPLVKSTTPSGSFDLFDICEGSWSGGYYIACHGQTIYMNNRGSKVAYWTAGQGSGSTFTISYADPNLGESTTVTATPSTTATITTGKVYRIYNKSYAGQMLYSEGSSLYATTTKTEKELDQYWLVQGSEGNWTFRNLRTGKYIQCPSQSTRITTGDTKQTFNATLDEDENAYGIGVDMTNKSCIHLDQYYTPVGWSWSDNFTQSEWVFEEVGGTTNEYAYDDLYTIVKAFDGYSESMTAGKYYRLYNYSYNERLLTDNFKSSPATVSGISADNAKAEGSQIWVLEQSGSNYKLKNLMTGEYIANQTSRSSQFQMSSTGATFTLATVAADDNYSAPSFTFTNYSSMGIHCANTLSYNVVLWYTASSNSASRWLVKEVSLTDDEVEAIQQVYTDYTESVADYNTAVNNISTYNTKLQTLFDDYACTQLKSTYASMTDAELRSATTTLPTEIQDMAVAVKNNTWNTAKDATYNTYEKNFRIAPYEVYTNCNWNNITKCGPFAMLYNPTGITVEEDQIIQVYVSADAAADDAEILLHIVSDTNRYPDQTVTLSKGLNYVFCTTDGEVFIDYTLNNAPNGVWNGSTIDQYPDITAHIEGGTCSGMWDMHRGMTNDDWTWLASNMFTNDILHVKGNTTMLNVLTSKVKSATQPVEIMDCWDFCFDTEESLMGCDQYINEKAYKPMINSRHSYTGNPNWDGGHGANHSDISTSGMFNVSNLYNTGTDGGSMWEITHEEGHAHQYLIKMAGTTEETNNSLAQCVNFLWNIHKTDYLEGDWINRSCRHDGVKALIQRYNDHPFSWIDYARSGNCSDDSYSSLWIANKWFFQLWLYFDYMGNYQPKDGTKNTGFSFVSALSDKLRADGITYGWSASSPAKSTDDYLKIAKYCAEIAEADLSEYFQVWGFFQTTPAVSATGDVSSSNTWIIGDYSTYYIQTSDADASAVKTAMQAYSKKLGNIVFLEDRGSSEDTWYTYNDYSNTGTMSTNFGETSWYGTFMDGVGPAYSASVSGTTVTMSGGVGAVGYKIYDASGNLVWLSNTNSFTVSSAIATGISNGTYTIMVAQGDGTDVAVGEYDLTIGQMCKKIKKMNDGNTLITTTFITECAEKIASKK